MRGNSRESSIIGNARPNKAGRWKTSLKARGRCARVGRGRLITRYTGGFNVKTGTARKRVRQRGR